MNDAKEVITKYLMENNFEYEEIKHVPVMSALPPIPELVEKGYADIKNLLLIDDKGKFYHVCAHVEKQFKIKDLAQILECKKLSFVNEDVLLEKYKVYPGIVSILNLIEASRENVTVIIDKSLTKEKKMCFHPNQNDHMYAFDVMVVLKYLKSLNVEYKLIDIK